MDDGRAPTAHPEPCAVPGVVTLPDSYPETWYDPPLPFTKGGQPSGPSATVRTRAAGRRGGRRPPDLCYPRGQGRRASAVRGSVGPAQHPPGRGARRTKGGPWLKPRRTHQRVSSFPGAIPDSRCLGSSLRPAPHAPAATRPSLEAPRLRSLQAAGLPEVRANIRVMGS